VTAKGIGAEISVEEAEVVREIPANAVKTAAIERKSTRKKGKAMVKIVSRILRSHLVSL
jgi:hypothetical protein